MATVKIKVMQPEGAVTEERINCVAAYPVWCAHRTVTGHGERSDHYWTVTHRQTGLAIARSIQSSRKAKMLAAALQDTYPLKDEAQVNENKRGIVDLCLAYLLRSEMR